MSHPPFSASRPSAGLSYTGKEDLANVQICFQNGCIATLLASRTTEVKVRTMAITQPNAYILLDYTDQDIRVHRQASSEHIVARGTLRYKQESFIERIFVHKDNPLKLEIRNFLEQHHPASLTGADRGRGTALSAGSPASPRHPGKRRHVLSSTLYKVGQVNVCNRPIASSGVDRAEEFPACRRRMPMLKNTRPPTDVARTAAKASLNVACLLGIPSTLANRQATFQIQGVSQQRHQRIQTQQTRRHAFNRQVRPLTLRLKAQVSTAFLERRLDAPALDEPRHDVTCLVAWARREVSPRWVLGAWMTDHNP